MKKLWYNIKCKEQGRAKKIFLANNKKSEVMRYE